MIRLIKERDIETVCDIVNNNWKSVYSGYVNKELISDKGCAERSVRLKNDFLSGRLFNYVYEIDKKVIALLSFRDTNDIDKKGEFEIWRIYIDKSYQNKGIGSCFFCILQKKQLVS